MVKTFNAFQLTACFAAAPFGVGYLATHPFPYQHAAVTVAAVVYIVAFCGMVMTVEDSMK